MSDGTTAASSPLQRYPSCLHAFACTLVSHATHHPWGVMRNAGAGGRLGHRRRHVAGDRLAPGGRIVLLEAAPTRRAGHCDSPIFRARDVGEYLALFDVCGLAVRAITGVDPMPLKTMLLPYYRALPRPAALAALAAVTAVSLPIDAVLGRKLARASWHKVFVLEHAKQLDA